MWQSVKTVVKAVLTGGGFYGLINWSYTVQLWLVWLVDMATSCLPPPHLLPPSSLPHTVEGGQVASMGSPAYTAGGGGGRKARSVQGHMCLCCIELMHLLSVKTELIKNFYCAQLIKWFH